MAAAALLAQALVALAAVSPAAAAPPRPTASFSYSPPAPQADEAVTFDASSSTGGNGPVVSYRWDFGDGTVETHATPLASHAYLRPGTYTVTLTVTGQSGPPHTGTATRSVSVTSPAQGPPRAPPAGAPPASVADCADGADNDADGKVDFPADPGCGSAADPTEPEVATGILGPALLTPFPIVRIVGSSRRGGSMIRLLAVRAPIGSAVMLRCRGRGCPIRRQVRTVSRPQRVRFRRFERYLPAGVTLGIYVQMPRLIGKYTRFRIQSRRRPARVDRCLLPGQARPAPCPPLGDATSGVTSVESRNAG